MEPELWQRVEEVVQRVLELEESRRGEFLESSCAWRIYINGQNTQ